MNSKLSLSLSLAAAATLAACGGYETVTPAPSAAVMYPSGVAVLAYGPVVYPAPDLRPGLGRVESVTPVVYNTGADTGMRRLGLRMNDGTVQVLDTRGPFIAIGERVEITSGNYIHYPMASR